MVKVVDINYTYALINCLFFFFLMDGAPPEIYSLPLPAPLPFCDRAAGRRRSNLRLTTADLLHPRLGLVRLLPELARLAALAVGERDHVRPSSPLDERRDRARGAPDEVGRVRADDEQGPWSLFHDSVFIVKQAPITGEPPSIDDGHHVHVIFVEARLQQPIGHQCEPVFHRRVRGLAEICREHVACRACCADRLERLLPRDLARVDRREAALE